MRSLAYWPVAILAVALACAPASASGTLFASAIALPEPGRPAALCLTDLDHDGFLDLVVAHDSVSTLSVRRGMGDALFSPPADVAGIPGWHVVAGDYDQDGDMDVVVSHPSGMAFLPGLGDGTFDSKSDIAISYTYSFTAGDLDQNGTLDLVAATNSREVFVMAGNGNGTFQPAVPHTCGTNGYYPAQPSAVAIADVNQDSIPDLAVANQRDNSVSLLAGYGGGDLSGPYNYPSGPGSIDLVVADFDRNGIPDVAVACWNIAASQAVGVLLGAGNGVLAPVTRYGAGNYASRILSADVDGDGNLDLLVMSYFDQKVSVLLGHGDGTFAPKDEYGIGVHARDIAVGDVNADGRPDILSADWESNQVRVLLNIGGQTPASAPSSGAATLRLAPPRPSPARGAVTFSFALSAPGRASLRIFDLAGRDLRTLPTGWVSGGEHEIRWDARTTHGSRAKPGVYLCRLEAAGVRSEVRRIVLVE